MRLKINTFREFSQNNFEMAYAMAMSAGDFNSYRNRSRKIKQIWHEKLFAASMD